jgi:Uma2 family endonuclease
MSAISMFEAPHPRLLTAEEFYHLDCDNCELVRGEVVQLMRPGFQHGRLAVRASRAIDAYAEEHDLGATVVESGFVLHRGPDTVRGPDVAFVCKARVVNTKKFFDGAPDLAVEVLSPDARVGDLKARLRDFFAAGVRIVWVIDPEDETVTVHTKDSVRVLHAPDVLDGGDVLPGFTLPLAKLFAP